MKTRLRVFQAPQSGDSTQLLKTSYFIASITRSSVIVLGIESLLYFYANCFHSQSCVAL